VKPRHILLLLTVLSLSFWGQDAKTTSTPTVAPPTLASAVDRDNQRRHETNCRCRRSNKRREVQFLSRDTLNIPGSHYNGVRSFSVQVKHVAASSLRTVIF
jgi:hypothetical protein